MKTSIINFLTASIAVTSASLAAPIHSPEGAEIGLDTDHYYTMGVKAPSLASGFVTYSDVNKRSPSGYYVQLATQQLEKYNAGREWRGNALWKFYPSEVPNYYSIGIYRVGNGSRDPNVYLTYTSEDTLHGNGNYMQIADINHQHFAPRGQWRDSALWGIYPSEAPGYFSLAPKSLPNGYMTTTSEPSSDGLFMQILHKQNLDKCRIGGEWRDHVLWGFWKVSAQDVETQAPVRTIAQTPTNPRKVPPIICGTPFPFPVLEGSLDFPLPFGGRGRGTVNYPLGGTPTINGELNWNIPL